MLYAVTTLGAFAAALALTALVIRLSRALRLLDAPGVRKVHTQAVSRLGGLAIALGAIGAALGAMACDGGAAGAFRGAYPASAALLAGAAAMLLVGLIDDLRGLPSKVKFLAQIAAASGAWALGIRIESLAVGDWFRVDFAWLSLPLTVLWITGITNAVNLIDGLDGLAAGIAAVACAVIAVLSLCLGQPLMAVLMLATLGSLLGFLVFNFNPARIFMGDGGTYFLGFLLGAGSVLCSAKSSALLGLALPAIALGLPIFDTLFSMLRRVLERRSLFAPDRGHIHHRLLAMGLRQRHVVLILYSVTVLAAGMGMFLLVTRNAGTIVVLLGILVLVVMVFRFAGAFRLRDALAAALRNREFARQARQLTHDFEAAQLQLRETRSFDQRWHAFCLLAERIGFVRLLLTASACDGPRTLEWRRPGEAPRGRTIRFTVPLAGGRFEAPLELQGDAAIRGSLEDAGRRVLLLGRLLDEYGLEDLANGEPKAA